MDTLMYEKPGYKTLILRNLAVAPDEMGPSAVDMEKGTGALDRDATHNLMRKDSVSGPTPQPEISGQALSPQLYSWLGAKGSSFPVGAAAAAMPTPQSVIVPNSIKVGHNCTVSNNQIICTAWDPAISLETYVSNGLLGEWLSPWVDDSLKAGSVAYRSYGAWRVAHPLSANYDICDSALCQVYNPAMFKPTTREKADVSATLGVVLSSDNVNIFKAEHAAESNLASDTQYATCHDGQVGEPAQGWPCMKDFVDTGKHQASTHSRGMCQRGSQRWASGLDNTGAQGDTGQPILNSDGVPIMPRDWRCILNHYYNADANSILVDPTGTGSPGAGSGLRTAFMQGQLAAFGYVAYEAIPSGTGRGAGIRAARTADGSNDYQIVSAGTYPSWEPGGNRLAYTIGGTGMFVVNADGLNNTLIVPEGCGPGVECDFAPSWSPFGDKIAFCSYRGNSWHIWTVNPDGSQLQQIPTTISVQDASYENESCYIRWSPDAKKIAFTGLTANIPYASRYNVYTMNIDGSNLVQLTNCQISGGGGASVCSMPSWSPDGTKIAFSDQDTFYGDNYGGSGLYIMNPDGTGITPVYQNLKSNELFPQWSSDGKQFVFMGQYSFGLSTYDIWTLNVDGSNPDPIIPATKTYYPWAIDCSHCSRFDK